MPRCRPRILIGLFRKLRATLNLSVGYERLSIIRYYPGEKDESDQVHLAESLANANCGSAFSAFVFTAESNIAFCELEAKSQCKHRDKSR